MTRLLHVALAVTDLQKSIAWYENFGFQKYREWQAEDGSLTIAHLKCEEGNLELFWQPGTKPAVGTPEPPGDFSRAGLKHFCLETEDLDGRVAELRTKGISPATDAQHARSLDSRYLFFKDPDGHGVELMQFTHA